MSQIMGGGGGLTPAQEVQLAAAAAGGPAAMQLRTEQSKAGTVEENNWQSFYISLMDIDTGPIAIANIDITGIVVEMAKSTLGGAFIPLGITQPVFAVGIGMVFVNYQFLAAEWQVGDQYRLIVSGIEATIDGDISYVEQMVWSNLVVEALDLQNDVTTILGRTDVATSTRATQADILSDATPFPGANIDDTISSRSDDVDTEILYSTPIDGAKVPVANTISDILHKDGGYTYDNTTDSLEAVRDGSDLGYTNVTGTGFTPDTHSLINIFNAIRDITSAKVYVDSAGNDATGDGTEDNPYLTLQNAYDEGVTLYTSDFDIIVSDTLNAGFDTVDGGVTGLTINANRVRLFIEDNIAVTNSIANADNVITGSGVGVEIHGGQITLANTNGDEEVIFLTGASAHIEDVNLVNPVGTNGWRGIRLTGDDSHAIHNHFVLFDDIGIVLDGVIDGHTQNNIVSGCINQGLRLINVSSACVLEDDKCIFNGTGVLIDAGCVDNMVYSPDFTANTTNYTNNGGATNHLVDAKDESQIATDNTIQQDWVDIYNKTQTLEVSITAAANAGITTVATVGTQPVRVKSIVVHADTAQTGDMTSCAVEGGVGQVVTFINAATATQANLNAADKQVYWTGAVRLAVGKIIYIDLQGTGATAVDLTVSIEYEPIAIGGVLT